MRSIISRRDRSRRIINFNNFYIKEGSILSSNIIRLVVNKELGKDTLRKILLLKNFEVLRINMIGYKKRKISGNRKKRVSFTYGNKGRYKVFEARVSKGDSENLFDSIM